MTEIIEDHEWEWDELTDEDFQLEEEPEDFDEEE